jgi:hypothetical protein
MSETRTQAHEELGKLMRREGEEKALALVSAFVTGYKAGAQAAKEKTDPESKPDPETEKAG